MGFSGFIGRVLLALIFVLAGVSKLQDPTESAKFLTARYPAVHQLIESKTKQYFPLPEQLSPKFIGQQSKLLIQVVGGLEVGLGVFVILNQCWAGALLSFLTLSFIFVIHNPFLFGNTKETYLFESIHALLDLALAGALLMVGCKKSSTCAPKAQESKKTSAQPSKKSKKRD